MTWKGTFYTEYAWSLCGSSLLFSRACGRPKATNTPRLFSNLLHFLFLFLPLVAPPARTLCAEIPPSLALHTPARVHTLPQLLFALLLTHDHRACTHSSFTSGRSCFVRRRCCGALRAKRGVFLGTQSSAGVCVCVCVSIQSLWYSSHMK